MNYPLIFLLLGVIVCLLVGIAAIYISCLRHRHYTLDEYQDIARSTCTPTCDNLDYPVHEIIEESAELYEKFCDLLSDNDLSGLSYEKYIVVSHVMSQFKAHAKSVRHGDLSPIDTSHITPEQRLEMAYELGDVLWGIALASHQLGYKLSEVALLNNAKLRSRFRRHVIEGDGDHR